MTISRGSTPSSSPSTSMLNVRKYRSNELPCNVSTTEQLIRLPIEFLSENPSRPLLHVIESKNSSKDGGQEQQQNHPSNRDGNNDDTIVKKEETTTTTTEVHEYALNPLTYSVIMILLVELLERFSFYGIEYTQTSFLTGAYNPEWNSGMTSVEASSFVSVSTAVAYTAPFVGALLADCVLGDYWVIILGMACLYTPGLMLIQMTTIPHFLGRATFPTNILAFGLLVLWPIGAGVIKSVVNIFGAKQYHPVLQSALIESYYVNFYMCINVGALVGGILVPLVAQHDIVAAYAIPVLMLAAGVALFISFNGRYVKRKPQGDLRQALNAIRALFHFDLPIFSWGRQQQDDEKDSSMVKGSSTKSTATYQAKQLRNVMMISALVVPFNVAYSQMATVFIVQGTVMKNALWGTIDAAMMNNCDAISVLVCGFLVGTYFYPALASQNIKIYTTYKFAIGSFCGFLAIAWALFIEYSIHSTYETTSQKVNILWLSMSYFLIGAGEIFAISAAYEVAFAIAPKEQKALCSAINLFCIGGVPNIVCMFLYQFCRHWFTNKEGSGNISDIQSYNEAHVYNYFWVLLGIAGFGTIINMLPFVRDWVANVEQEVLQRKKEEQDAADEADEAKKIILLSDTEKGTSSTGSGSGSWVIDPQTKKKHRLTSMTAPTSSDDENNKEKDPLLGGHDMTRLRLGGGSATKKSPAMSLVQGSPSFPPKPPIGTPNKVKLHVQRKAGPQKKLAKQKREFVMLNRFGSQYGSTNT